MTLLVLAAPMLMLLLMLAMERFEAVLLPARRAPDAAAPDAPAPDAPQGGGEAATAAGGGDEPREPRVPLASRPVRREAPPGASRCRPARVADRGRHGDVPRSAPRP